MRPFLNGSTWRLANSCTWRRRPRSAAHLGRHGYGLVVWSFRWLPFTYRSLRAFAELRSCPFQSSPPRLLREEADVSAVPYVYVSSSLPAPEPRWPCAWRGERTPDRIPGGERYRTGPAHTGHAHARRVMSMCRCTMDSWSHPGRPREKRWCIESFSCCTALRLPSTSSYISCSKRWV